MQPSKQQLVALYANEKLTLNESSLHKKHILVVEDNTVNQKLLSRILEKHHYEYQIAKDVNEAIKILEQYAFDVVLMDIQMPELDGLAATKIIREKEKATPFRKPIPIIGISAFANLQDKEKARVAGMNDYITKPFKGEDIHIKLLYWTNFNLQLKPHLAICESPTQDSHPLHAPQSSSLSIFEVLKSNEDDSKMSAKEKGDKSPKKKNRKEANPNTTGLNPE